MNRDFKGIWIPKELWLDDSLTKIEILFLTEIDSLDNENGCFAGNEYFSRFFDLSKNRCSEIITSLKNKGKLSIDYEYEGKKIIKRIIRCTNKYKMQSSSRKTEGVESKNRQTPSENKEDINTNNNTPIFSDEKIDNYFHEKLIIKYWNDKNINGIAEPCKPNKSVLNNIRATINQYSEDIIKNCIDNMYVDKWSIENRMISLNRLIKSGRRDTNIHKFNTYKSNVKIPQGISPEEYRQMQERYKKIGE